MMAERRSQGKKETVSEGSETVGGFREASEGSETVGGFRVVSEVSQFSCKQP